MATIEITWTAYGTLGERRSAYIEHLTASGERVFDDVSASFDFDLDFNESDLEFCERVFVNTNRYAGKVWDAVEPQLPPTRSHTALSVGDFVSIDGREYVCADLGFKRVS